MRKNYYALIVSILSIALFLGTFGLYKNDVKAAESDAIYVCESATSDLMYVYMDNEYIKIDELAMCCDLNKPTPRKDNRMTRELLSETDLTAEQKSKLAMIMIEQDNLKSMISDIASGSNPRADMAAAFLRAHSDDLYIPQYFIWIAMDQEFFLTYQYPYAYKGLYDTFDKTSDSYDAEDSFWSVVLKPVVDYINANYTNYPVSTAPGDYDAYFYYPTNTGLQRILGMAHKNPDATTGYITINKTFDFPRGIDISTVEPAKFRIISTNGTVVGTFPVTGADSVATVNNGVYTLQVPVSSKETYTVQELGGYQENTELVTNYSVNGVSGTGTKATNVAAGSTVDFTNSYVSLELTYTIEKYFYDKNNGNPLSEDEINNIEISLGKINASGDKEIIEALTIGKDFKFDSAKGCYYYTATSIDPETTYFVSEKNCDFKNYDSEHVYSIDCINYYSGEKVTTSTAAMEYDESVGYYTNPRVAGKNQVTMLANGYFLNYGSLEITKTIEGDITEEDKSSLTFTVTDSNGKVIGTYVLGKDFDYDATTDTYKKVLTDVDPRLTYNVEETAYDAEGFSATVSYTVGGSSSSEGAAASDVVVNAGSTTTVAFTDSYVEITTDSSTEPTVTPTPTEAVSVTSTPTPTDAAPTESATATPTAAATSTSTTTTATKAPTATPSSSKSATPTPAASTSTSTSTSDSSESGNSTSDSNIAKDSTSGQTTTADNKVVNVTKDGGSSDNDEVLSAPTATPAPTATTAPAATATPVPNKAASGIAKTGEAISLFTICGIGCAVIAGGVLVFRAKKKEN